MLRSTFPRTLSLFAQSPVAEDLFADGRADCPFATHKNSPPPFFSPLVGKSLSAGWTKKRSPPLPHSSGVLDPMRCRRFTRVPALCGEVAPLSRGTAASLTRGHRVLRGRGEGGGSRRNRDNPDAPSGPFLYRDGVAGCESEGWTPQSGGCDGVSPGADRRCSGRGDGNRRYACCSDSKKVKRTGCCKQIVGTMSKPKSKKQCGRERAG